MLKNLSAGYFFYFNIQKFFKWMIFMVIKCEQHFPVQHGEPWGWTFKWLKDQKRFEGVDWLTETWGKLPGSLLLSMKPLIKNETSTILLGLSSCSWGETCFWLQCILSLERYIQSFVYVQVLAYKPLYVSTSEIVSRG